MQWNRAVLGSCYSGAGWQGDEWIAKTPVSLIADHEIVEMGDGHWVVTLKHVLHT